MLRFEQLRIKNFGPFKGEQSIDFGKQNGVTIIWGDNGRGKTTLLNVFRYALFGHIKDRRGSGTNFLTLSNIEAVEEGNYGFTVALRMRNGDDSYTLTRAVRLREDVRTPKANEDFIEECFLKKNGSILSVTERDRELALLMPPDIARFFLFDGELLQEYEALLDDTSNDGRLIKDSIEKILGMPVLTNGFADIHSLVSEYITAKNKAAQNDKNTAEFANAIALLLDQIAGHEAELARLEAELKKEEAALQATKLRMDETEKLRQLLTEKKTEQQRLSKLKGEREELLADIQANMKTAWQALAQSTVAAQIELLRQEVEAFSQKKAIASASATVLKQMEQAINTHHCEVCDQAISDELIVKLQERLNTIKSAAPLLTAAEQAQLQQAQQRLRALQTVNLQNNSVIIDSKVKELSRKDIEISSCEQAVRDLDKQISTYGEFDENELIGTLVKDYTTHNAKIKAINEGIAGEKKAIAEATDKRQKLDAKVSSLSKNKDVLSASARLELCQKLESIFAMGVDQYRTRLKQNVQNDASSLFTKLSADIDYERLEINDNYGLNIIHRKGIAVPSRSAGFEHVVALSLIGALHKNAPMQGPVIMDSPFGRLGAQHERNVSRNLPQLSDQVIILVHDRELDPDQTRLLLGSQLHKEYRLERVTSFHTKIC